MLSQLTEEALNNAGDSNAALQAILKFMFWLMREDMHQSGGGRHQHMFLISVLSVYISGKKNWPSRQVTPIDALAVA